MWHMTLLCNVINESLKYQIMWHGPNLFSYAIVQNKGKRCGSENAGYNK